MYGYDAPINAATKMPAMMVRASISPRSVSGTAWGSGGPPCSSAARLSFASVASGNSTSGSSWLTAEA